ncbi:MAG TPA: hypothetical protein VJK50_04820 [Patescibacteria group bacterium]|nr:hypothetical protein [Patescibacteria group bacterium]
MKPKPIPDERQVARIGEKLARELEDMFRVGVCLDKVKVTSSVGDVKPDENFRRLVLEIVDHSKRKTSLRDMRSMTEEYVNGCRLGQVKVTIYVEGS